MSQTLALRTSSESLFMRLADRPRALLNAFLALHVLIWSAVPAIFQPNLPLDVIEQLAWGREWQLTYFKHPPLPAWILETWAHLTGGSDRAIFIVGPLASAIALWLVYKLAAEILDQKAALIAVLLQEGVLYFTFFTPEFNHNVVQLPLWAWIGWSAYRALTIGRLRDWAILGVAAALGMLGKYSTALLLATIATFLLADPVARAWLRKPGPWLAFSTMCLALAPHVAALAGIGFAPFRFPIERAHAARGAFDRLVFPLKFAGAQVLDVLPALLMMLGVRQDRASPASSNTAFQRRFVAAIAWGPFLVSVAASALLGRQFKDMWATPFWNWFGLFVVLWIWRGAPRPTRVFPWIWGALFLLGPVAYAAQFPGQLLARHAVLRSEFPGAALSKTLADRWQQRFGTPVRTVIGSVWLAGNVAFPLWPDRPSVMIDGDPAKSPWIDEADLRCRGALLLWDNDIRRQELLSAFPAAQEQSPVDLPPRSWAHKPDVRIGWAVLAPQGVCAAH